MISRIQNFLSVGEKRWGNAFWASTLFILWAWIYLPELGRTEFIHEEGRRALCAREMQENQNYILPTVLGDSYLNKPPGLPWLILGLSQGTGGVNEWSVRLGSALATLGTACLIFFFVDAGDLRARFWAAAWFLLSFMSLEKGRLGEVEALLVFLSWGALWCWWQGWRKVRDAGLWWWLSGLFLGSALLVKGPPVLVFYYGTLVSFCVIQKRVEWFLSWAHLVIFLTAVGVVCLWLVPLLHQTGLGKIVETGSREIVERGAGGVPVFLNDHEDLIIGSFIGFLPGALLVIAWFWRSRWCAADSILDAHRFLFCLVLSGYLFFLYYPGSRSRYLYPIAPGIAWLAALVWMRIDTHKSLRTLGNLFLSIVLLMSAVSLAALTGLCILRPGSSLYFIVLAIVILLLAIVIIRHWSRRFTFPAMIGQLILIACLSQVGVWVRNGKQELAIPLHESAKQAALFVPVSQTIYTLSQSQFNLLAYVDFPVRYVTSLANLPKNGQPYYVIFQNVSEAQELAVWNVLDFCLVPLKRDDNIWILKLSPIQ